MLQQIPTAAHLSRLYFELACQGARAVGKKTNWPYAEQLKSCESLLCLAADMSRFDPRLFEILVEWVFVSWQNFNPLKLRHHMTQMQTPQTLCVIFEFVAQENPDLEIQAFTRYVCDQLRPVQTQLYFKNFYTHPGSYLVKKATFEPIQEFLTWGFLADIRPVLFSKQRKAIGHWSPEARQNIIRRLSQDQKTFSLADYLKILDHSISRQLALKDLKESPFVKSKGKGRGSFWVKIT